MSTSIFLFNGNEISLRVLFGKGYFNIYCIFHFWKGKVVEYRFFFFAYSLTFVA